MMHGHKLEVAGADAIDKGCKIAGIEPSTASGRASNSIAPRYGVLTERIQITQELPHMIGRRVAGWPPRRNKSGSLPISSAKISLGFISRAMPAVTSLSAQEGEFCFRFNPKISCQPVAIAALEKSARSWAVSVP